MENNKTSKKNIIQLYDFPVNDPAKNIGVFEVEGPFVKNKTYPHKTTVPHRHSYFEICFFVNGDGVHEIDFKQFIIKSNSIHFITPGQVHLISRGNNYKGYLLVFSEEFYRLNAQQNELLSFVPFLHSFFLNPILNTDENTFKKLLDIVLYIKDEIREKSSITPAVAAAYLQVLLLKARQLFDNTNRVVYHKKDIPSHIISDFRKLVEKHHKEKHLVSEYASLMNYSSVHLNKMIKKGTGRPASELIMDRIILEAKRLILFSGMNSKEIAYFLSFKDPSHFSRVFKNKTGMTPVEFRKNMIEKYQIKTN